MSEAGILDFAGLDAAAAAVDTTPTDSVDTTVDTTTTEVTDSGAESTAEGTTEAPTEGGETAGAEGDKAGAEAAGEKGEAKATDTDLPGDEKTPQEIRKVLKAIQDSNPALKSAVKQLHGAFERYNAFKEIYPTVQAAQEAKAFIDNIGGIEGYEKQQQIVQSVEETDQLLYAGGENHVKLLDNIYDDMKSEGKQAEFSQLARPLLDKLKTVDPDAFYKTLTPHYVASLEGSRLPNVISAVAKALEAGDPKSLAAAKEMVADMGGWFKDLKGEVEKAKADAVNPERLAIQKEREALNKEKAEVKTKEQQAVVNDVGKSVATSSNTMLGSELGKFLKEPYFAPFKKNQASLKPLARQIQENLHAELTADKGYQTQMKALMKNPDKAKVLQYHKIKVEAIAPRIVRDTVNLMYPDHAKGGSAAGRIAIKEQKTAAQTKKDTVTASTGAAQYVAVKPKNLNREMDPKGWLETAGKGYIPNGKGGWRLVTWRKPSV